MSIAFSATYSPEDNKLRLYASARLDAPTYQRVRGAGFIWAPKQALFVAPMWTPERAELCEELAGEIGDEDTSLVERAEQRAERFDEYSDRRSADSAQASEAVRRLTEGIPLGQPILVGHHSERRARKDAERIENGMRKAVKMWETAQYWTDRAAGALRHAKYKELPAVRARRIKGIEADARKVSKSIERSQHHLKLWQDPLAHLKRKDGTAVTMREAVIYLGNCDNWNYLESYKRASGYQGPMGLWEAAGGNIHNTDPETLAIATPEEICAYAIENHTVNIARASRWLSHYQNRLAYERAMLEEQGAENLLAKKPRPAQLPMCNYLAPDGVEVPNPYQRGEMIHYPQVSLTQAEYAKIAKDYKGTRIVGRSHRVRTAMIRHSLVCVFLADAKTHTAPAPIETPPPAPKAPAIAVARSVERTADTIPSDITAMRESLRVGVNVSAVPQLFPTPAVLAARMIDQLRPEAGSRVLEPSAGTGQLLRALPGVAPFGASRPTWCREVVAVELNRSLCAALAVDGAAHRVVCADFLTCLPDADRQSDGESRSEPLGRFDGIVMNPPFKDSADIAHIMHAMRFLEPGGRLVALCADGPRQGEKLRPLAEGSGGWWESLPEGSFAEHGTAVRVAMLVIEAGAQP
jgi:protein-L-isoaspartate O-methyltransferase